MQNTDQLNEAFAIPEVLTFDEPHAGMPRARIQTPCCTAELYLQGAHLTQWQPTGEQPVLFLSDRSLFTPGKAIRGGVPVIFPWFGSPDTSPVHPPPGSSAHGYARIWPWTLRFAAVAGDNVHLSLTLDHNDRLHALGFDFLQLGIELILGRRLTLRLTAVNTGSAPQPGPFLFEEALHAYLHVGAIDQISIEGLAGTEYLDKTQNFRRETQTEPLVRFHGETDRPYLNTSAPVTLVDPVLQRRIVLTKTNSNTSVIWNPAAALAAKLPDLGPEEWRRFACVETANAGENAIPLAQGQAYTMGMQLAVEAF